jgi:hypothetical protein
MSNKRQSRKSKRQRSSVSDTPRSSSSRASVSTEFNPDYSQTIKDLKRIGLLAGTFFTILLVLAFFLR